MNVSLDSKKLPLVLSIVALVALVLVGAFVLFVPKPSTAGLARAENRKQMDARIKTKNAEDRIAAAEAIERRFVTKGTDEQIAPLALAQVNLALQGTDLKLVAFRPQRAGSTAGLDQLPYLVTVEGTYPDVLKFAEALERPMTKLALNLFQISSADNASDRVTASLGVIAYGRAPVIPTTTPARGTGSTPAPTAVGGGARG